ncbi:hypothetical protein [Lactococcus petauri]|uniref:NAD(+) ADP-ribosyltransferase n=1 Tax=Lactococcus petauri TaxID=1940789 RepID=A0A252CF54_9LACT|nr:hypothetical protein [Lactococcus petauri]OUK05172.1 hypothetical protein BZZ03_00175 [Lactococcus petauri]
MNEFMNFITQLNKVKTKSDPEFTWLTDFSHYAFLSNGGAEEEKYLGFVSNLIGSYYELLLKPFVNEEEIKEGKHKKNAEASLLTSSREVKDLLTKIVLSDVWHIIGESEVQEYSGSNTIRDLVLIGLLVVMNKLEAFDELKAILTFISQIEIHEPHDLIAVYELLAVRYETREEDGSITRRSEQDRSVDLLKILPLLSFKIEEADCTSKEMQLIISELGKSHHVKDYLVNLNKLRVFEVHSQQQSDNFNPKKLKTRLFVHGTRNKNVLSILENGIESSPQVIATGSSLGVGAYFAKMTEVGKSAQYSDDYLIIAEVAVGKRKYTNQVHDFRHEILDPRTPYQSIHYQGGAYSSFSYDEIVVYSNSQIKVKYIMQLK